jgi:GT2 family glycosyltransferase
MSTYRSLNDVSVVIVSWNCVDYLRECLKSLAADSERCECEIIVVDNASHDNTVAMVKDTFPVVRLIVSETNLGFAGGNNLALKVVSRPYIALINPDVNVPEGCLDSMVSYMDQNPEIGLLGPRMMSADGTTARSTMRFPTIWNTFCRAVGLDSIFKRSKIFGGFLMSEFDHDQTTEVQILNGWFWLTRREAIDEVGLLDSSLFMYGEDLDWCRRYHEAGWKVVFYANAEATHYGAGSSKNAPIRSFLEMQRANCQYWKKYHGRFSTLTYKLLICLHHAVRVAGYSFVFLAKHSSRLQAAYKIRRGAAAIRWMMSESLEASGRS